MKPLRAPFDTLVSFHYFNGRASEPVIADMAAAQHLARTFHPVGPIDFTSVCEHHILPFTGTAWVAYLPQDRVVGLSKIPRLVHHYAGRPQIQERLTQQVTAALDTHLATAGSACVIRATHSCMSLRGVRAVGAAMVTSSLTGAFRDDASCRAEFMALTHGGTGQASA